MEHVQYAGSGPLVVTMLLCSDSSRLINSGLLFCDIVPMLPTKISRRAMPSKFVSRSRMSSGAGSRRGHSAVEESEAYPDENSVRVRDTARTRITGLERMVDFVVSYHRYRIEVSGSCYQRCTEVWNSRYITRRLQVNSGQEEKHHSV